MIMREFAKDKHVKKSFTGEQSKMCEETPHRSTCEEILHPLLKIKFKEGLKSQPSAGEKKPERKISLPHDREGNAVFSTQTPETLYYQLFPEDRSRYL